MEFIYSTGIRLLSFLYWSASWFHPKAKAFVLGREAQKQEFERAFSAAQGTKVVWFHCASLGEFEQARPVMEAMKSWVPRITILLTFFSPSGYEVRKNYEVADHVFYLPWDTRRNARQFIDRVRPSLAIFIKYEFWYHYTQQLHQRGIPLISVSAIFRPEQIFFKSHGALFRSMLKSFHHFFVQNQASADLLRSVGVTRATITGDTRFDRVHQIMTQAEEVPAAAAFKNNKRLMVVGSAWPADMEVLYPFINENPDLKFIIAPHEIKEEFIHAIEESIEGQCVRLSKNDIHSLAGAHVLIVDNIGLLSRLYRYGEFAFVGGGFGEGLHNILEAACYGIPVFFGNKAYDKYDEAVNLVALGGAFEIGTFSEIKTVFDRLTAEPHSYQLACEVARQYVLQNLGATAKILDYCKKILA